LAQFSPDSQSPNTGSTTRIRFRVRIQGNLLQVTKKIANALTPCDVGRGVVTNFTKGARLRMLKTIAKIDWGRVPFGVFITLTYPDTRWETDYDNRTIQRSRFIRDLEKYLDREISVLWRTEWKKRQSGERKGEYAPHLHLMCLGTRFVCSKWVRTAWRSILSVTGALATDVRGVSGAEGCGKYLAKYISKSSSLDNAAYLNRPWMRGRHWGLTRPSLVPWADVEHDREISEDEYFSAMQAHLEMATWQGAKSQESITVLGEQRKKKFLDLWGNGSCGPYEERR